MIHGSPQLTTGLVERALRVLHHPASGVAQRLDVLVAIAAHGEAIDLDRCLSSIEQQVLDASRLGIVVLIDSPHVPATIPPLRTGLEGRAWVITANCGTAARARNTLLDFIDTTCPAARWVARLDWDDAFATDRSLACAVRLAEQADAAWVLGGNRVLDRSGALVRENPATVSLRDPQAVLHLLAAMAEGSAPNELPSCNLLLAARSGLRYTDVRSAEDHWLVARLLLVDARRGAILEQPLYADYAVHGSTTADTCRSGDYAKSRRALWRAAQAWVAARSWPGTLLGLGQEGIVRRHGGEIVKSFYADVLADEQAAWLQERLASCDALAPAVRMEWDASRQAWTGRYPDTPSAPATGWTEALTADFIARCVREGLVFGDIKRSNFRIAPDGRLLFVDIGTWIRPMDTSILRDAATRLYAQSVLGWPDDELLQRPVDPRRAPAWERLPGFAACLGRAVGGALEARLAASPWQAPPAARKRDDVTLLVKACAMDAASLGLQVEHLLAQLCEPEDVAERILLVDPHAGPFPRAHAAGDLAHVLDQAHALRERGLVDRVLVPSMDAQDIRALNQRWFGMPCDATRSSDGVPVYAHLWGLEQVRTRHVLQCDVDVLVGRRDPAHTYLAEMVTACQQPGVLGVAFNIPHAPDARPVPYAAPPGEHKPEVRCGLLDLHRIREVLPLPNTLQGGVWQHTWYRSMHAYQRQHGARTLRGGDPRTFYVHPPNTHKQDLHELLRKRDILARGTTPSVQWEHWDLVGPAAAWAQPRRDEEVVVLAYGCDAPTSLIERFARGLAMQDDRTFGVVVLDDATSHRASCDLERCLRWLGARRTVVRCPGRAGRLELTRRALREVGTHPRALLLLLDADGALAHPEAISRARMLASRGHDIIEACSLDPGDATRLLLPSPFEPQQARGGPACQLLHGVRRELLDSLHDTAAASDHAPSPSCEACVILETAWARATSPARVPEYWHVRQEPPHGAAVTRCVRSTAG